MIDQNKLDTLFLKAKNAPHTSVFQESKEHFLMTVIADDFASKKKFKITLKQAIIMILIAGAIAATCVLLTQDNQERSKQDETPAKVEFGSLMDNKDKVVETKSTLFIQPKRSSETIKLIESDSSKVESKVEEEKSEEIHRDSIQLKRKDKVNQGMNQFIFPKLTKKEIAENNKRKKKMLKALNKKDKKVYSYIPSGSFTYNSKPVSVQSFHMQRTEVTNLAYKTFIFDLLIQGRKDDFLIAKPKQELWTEDLGDEYRFLQDNYFSDEEYEDYPVNNISRLGAEMYCTWITQEANKINKESGNALINDVRIPSRVEWYKAASEDGRLSQYSWGDSVSALIFQSNFSMKGYKIPEFKNRGSEELVAVGDSTALTTGGALFKNVDVVVKSKSYGYNEYGMYCMNGNVAEMVYESSSKLQPGTAGGGWMETEDEIKLSADDKYKGITDEHLNIGFRVVITYFNPQR